MNAMPPYPEYSGSDWAAIWEEHLDNNTPYLLQWLSHQTDGPYWRGGSIRGRYDRVRCPVFMIGGWRDGYPNPPLRTFANLDVPRRLLMGPWNHTRPEAAIPGPRIAYLREVVRWYDHWLKGEENGVMEEPPVQIYVQSFDEPRADRLETSGYWRAENDLAPTDGEELRLALRDGGLLSAVRADATCQSADSEGSGCDEYEYRPTVGVAGGLWSGGVPYGLPTDQRLDEIHALNYTSEPLAEPLEIIGWPRASLHVSSTASVMAFVCRLCDVAPDGTSALICSGVLNGTRRNSLEEPEPLEPGQVYLLDIQLDATAWRFEPGHRIRLSVCSADFPNLWPTPQRGTNRLFHTDEYLSELILPRVPTRSAEGGALPADELLFEPGEAGVEPYSLSPSEPAWQIVHDQLGDRTGLRTVQKGMESAGDGLEVTSERTLDVWASNRDPADVCATGRHYRRIERRDGTCVVDCNCILRSTEDAFHLTVELDVTQNGLPHFQRRWVRSFPRVLL